MGECAGFWVPGVSLRRLGSDYFWRSRSAAVLRKPAAAALHRRVGLKRATRDSADGLLRLVFDTGALRDRRKKSHPVGFYTLVERLNPAYLRPLLPPAFGVTASGTARTLGRCQP